MTESTRALNFHGNQVYNPDEDPRIAYEVLATGLGMPSVATKLNVNARTLTRWVHDHPEFAEAVENGQAAAEHAIDSQAHAALTLTQDKDGPKTTFNTDLYKFTKRTRFRARENDPIAITVNAGVSDADTVAALVKRLHTETV